MGSITEELEFNCCHCGKNFKMSVQIADKGENSQLVNATVYCGHCGKACHVELYEHEVLTENVFRGESSWTQADIAQLKNQVFSTKP
ncbi:MAG: hypothetical protein VSS52_005835, partial [Thiotrichaceae bacterium]|nr:hypothetical protein [Thiotrichaceae bacterium]